MNIMHPPAGLILPAWREGDGIAPYVWNRLPKGHKCAWSVTWLLANPDNPKAVYRIGPENWKNSAPDLMTDEQLLGEMGDYKQTSKALEVYQLLEYDLPNVLWRKQAQKLIRDIRQSAFNHREYPAEFGAPGDEPFRIQSAAGMANMKPDKRPGWDILYLLEEK